MYKSTPHFQGQTSDFSLFQVKEVTLILENVLKTQGIKKKAEQNVTICCEVY